jgi:hypothetical protein
LPALCYPFQCMAYVTHLLMFTANSVECPGSWDSMGIKPFTILLWVSPTAMGPYSFFAFSIRWKLLWERYVSPKFCCESSTPALSCSSLFQNAIFSSSTHHPGLSGIVKKRNRWMRSRMTMKLILDDILFWDDEWVVCFFEPLFKFFGQFKDYCRWASDTFLKLIWVIF